MFEAGRDLADDVVLGDIGAPFGVQPLSLEDATAAVNADWDTSTNSVVPADVREAKTTETRPKEPVG